MKLFTKIAISYWLLTMYSCKPMYIVIDNNNSLYDVATKDTVAEIEQILNPYRNNMKYEMNQKVAYLGAKFVKNHPMGSLGLLVSEAMYSKALLWCDTLFNAYMNYGGIRLNELPKGEITKEKIFELLPFDNEIVIVNIQGNIVKKWNALMESGGGTPVVFYNRFKDNNINDTCYFFFNKETQMRVMNAVKIQDSAYYAIATNNYIAEGGDNCDFLIGSKKIYTGVLLRDALMEYMQHFDTLMPAEPIHIIQYKK